MKSSKLSLLIFLGVFFWFVAAMTVKLSGNAVFTEHNFYRILMFVAAFPITFIFLSISIKVANLKKAEILNAVVVMTITATFLDGIALTWFRQLYAETFEIALYGAAWILFGAGVGLLFGYVMTDETGKGNY
jgi:Family of unknown function (DUF5367)